MPFSIFKKFCFVFLNPVNIVVIYTSVALSSDQNNKPVINYDSCMLRVDTSTDSIRTLPLILPQDQITAKERGLLTPTQKDFSNSFVSKGLETPTPQTPDSVMFMRKVSNCKSLEAVKPEIESAASLPAVVIRRPGAKGVYGSPRRGQHSLEMEQWGGDLCHRTLQHVKERLMVIGDSPIGCLQANSWVKH